MDGDGTRAVASSAARCRSHNETAGTRGAFCYAKRNAYGTVLVDDVLHPDHAPPPGKTDTHFT
eukprot:532097-Prymnesium_polylepis.1